MLCEQLFVGATQISTHTWHHFAFVLSGTNFYIFLDGVLDGQGTFGTTGRTESFAVRIGRDVTNTGRDWNGWVDELRITKGAARYKENFTPPAGPSDYPV